MTPQNQKSEHQLKINSVLFKRVQQGEKTAEIRKNDRDFQTGDFISLNAEGKTNPEEQRIFDFVKYIEDGKYKPF